MNKTPRNNQLLIAIITHQRSGSKWVGSLLRDIYRTGTIGEAFSPNNSSIASFRSYISKNNLDSIMNSDINEIFDNYFDELRTYFGLFYSFDLMFNQIDWIDFGWRQNTKPIYDYLKSRGDLVVSLLRDKREIFLSMKTLEITKRPHFTSLDSNRIGSTDLASELLEERKVLLNCDEYRFFSYQIDKDRELLSESFRDYDRFVLLKYEDIVLNINTITNKIDPIIRDFGYSIGYEFGDHLCPFPNLKKYSTDYRKIFENYDEILDLD